MVRRALHTGGMRRTCKVDPDMSRDGNQLRRARQEAGLSARVVAEHMGVEHSTVLRWEADGRLWFWNAWSLAALYGCPVAAFGDEAELERWLAKRARIRGRSGGTRRE